MKFTHLPATEYTTVPWKNGGGQTQEMAVWPVGATMTNFHWRISMATVTQAGAFSVFADIDRHLTVLKGQLRLQVNNQWHRLKVRDSLCFAGDVPAFGAPVTAEAKDLNVMTRRGLYEARIEQVEAATPFMLGAGQGFMFAFEAVSVEGHDLKAGDLLRFEGTWPLQMPPLLVPVQIIYLLPVH